MCYKCKYNIVSIQELWIHLKKFHRFDITTKIQCGEDECYRYLSNIKSFRRHWNIEHSSKQLCTDAEDFNDLFLNTPANSDFNHENFSQPDNIPSVEQPTQFKDFDVKDFKEILQHDALLLISKLYNEPSIPRNHVQSVVEMTQTFMNDGLIMIKEKIINRLQTLGDVEKNLTEISSMFKTLKNPFQNLDTEYQRFKMLEETDNLILPEDYVIGIKYQQVVSENGHVKTDPVEVKGKCFPLRNIFKKLFESPGVYNTVMSYKSKLENETDVISNFIQGSLSKNKMKGQKGKYILRLFLSFDHYETGNVLGSHSGIHKLGGTCISMPCFPLEYRSLLKSIYIVLLFYSSDRKEFGNHAVFCKLKEELTFLQQTGIELNLHRGIKILYFQLGLILADNLGMY